MKICPQCNKTYNDDDVFCHEDGNALIEEGAEQETRQNPKFVMRPEAPRDQPPLPPPGNPPQPDPEPEYGETISFQPPVFKTPDTGSRPTPRPNNNGLILAAAGAIVIAVILIGVYGLGGGGSRGGNSTPDGKTTPTPAPTPKPGLPNTFDRQYSGTIAGQALSLNLVRNGGSLTGTAATSKTDTLRGTIQDNGDFSVDAFPIGKEATGIFSGHINDDGSITGTWTNRQGGKESRFQVEQIADKK